MRITLRGLDVRSEQQLHNVEPAVFRRQHDRGQPTGGVRGGAGVQSEEGRDNVAGVVSHGVMQLIV
jgi:hypothetical protein